MPDILTTIGVEVRADHISAIENMEPEARLAMAREVLAAMMIAEAKVHGKALRRPKALAAIFAAEAQALNEGKKAVIDFFLPLESDLPLAVDKPREVPSED